MNFSNIFINNTNNGSEIFLIPYKIEARKELFSSTSLGGAISVQAEIIDIMNVNITNSYAMNGGALYISAINRAMINIQNNRF